MRQIWSKLISGLKHNWQFLFLVGLLFFLLRPEDTFPVFRSQSSENFYPTEMVKTGEKSAGVSSGYPPSLTEPPPTTRPDKRLVVKNSRLSLLVKDVRKSQQRIIQKANQLGGYMVNSTLDTPEGIQKGSVTVRIPQNKLGQFLEYTRNLSVRVISENLVGYDVTDEYVDIQSRLESLYKTKTKFERLLEKADRAGDILEIQRELNNLQKQIDKLKGRQKYLQENAKLVKVTIYLSTDELSLPYTPSRPWSPKAIFKQAVRSLISTFRFTASAFIWVGVYSVIWLPVILVVLLIWKRIGKKK